MTREEEWVLREKYGGDASAAGFSEDCDRLAKGEPVAYVIGWQPFLGLKIRLDSKPLIPRPETEWWTEQLFKETQRSGAECPEASAAERTASPRAVAARVFEGGAGTVGHSYGRRAERGRVRRLAGAPTRLPDTPLREAPLRFLDLCAGSGAIGCAALARLPNARVYFGELDPAHEPTIQKNIVLAAENAASNAAGPREKGMIYHTLLARADVRIGDLFEPFGDMTFDVIACNPPYIPTDRALDTSVTEYEPHEALFSGADGLDLIRRLAREMPLHLNPGGIAYVECDAMHAEAARGLFEAAGLAASVIPDQYGVPRVLVVRLQA